MYGIARFFLQAGTMPTACSNLSPSKREEIASSKYFFFSIVAVIFIARAVIMGVTGIRNMSTANDDLCISLGGTSIVYTAKQPGKKLIITVYMSSHGDRISFPDVVSENGKTPTTDGIKKDIFRYLYTPEGLLSGRILPMLYLELLRVNAFNTEQRPCITRINVFIGFHG